MPDEPEGQTASEAPQSEPAEQETPYMPVPGQTTVEDLVDVVPEGVEEAAAGPSTDRADAPVGEKVIDAAYRELNIKPAAEQQLESAEQQAESAEQQAESVEYQPEMEEQQADIVEAGTYTNIEIKNAIISILNTSAEWGCSRTLQNAGITELRWNAYADVIHT